MSHTSDLHEITGDSPDASGTAAVGDPITGLELYGRFVVDATITGGTSGTVDAILQRRIDASVDEWVDWIHFPQVAAAATKHFTVEPARGGSILEVAKHTTETPAAAVLAANGVVPCHPGGSVRLVCTAGAGTSAGAAQVVRVRGFVEGRL